TKPTQSRPARSITHRNPTQPAQRPEGSKRKRGSSPTVREGTNDIEARSFRNDRASCSFALWTAAKFSEPSLTVGLLPRLLISSTHPFRWFFRRGRRYNRRGARPHRTGTYYRRRPR